MSGVVHDVMLRISVNRYLCFRVACCFIHHNGLRNGLIQLSKKWTTLMMEATSHLKYWYLFSNLHSLISPEDGNHLQDCRENLKSEITYSPHFLSFFVFSNFVCWNDTLNQCTEACIRLNHPIWDMKYGHPLEFRCRRLWNVLAFVMNECMLFCYWNLLLLMGTSFV